MDGILYIDIDLIFWFLQVLIIEITKYITEIT